MERPFPAYRGNESYVFVSYAHEDASSVYPELTWLNDCGFNVWYDEGIEAGTEWSEELANRIADARLFLYFVTPDSAESQNCRNEVNFALTNEIPTLAVHLKKTDLPRGLSLSLSARQAILKHAMPDQEYREKLHNRIATYLEQSSVQVPVPAKRRSIWSVIAAVAALGIGVLLYSQYVSEGTANEAEAFDWPNAFSIVVLPVEFTSTDAETRAISRGLTEDLVQQLMNSRTCVLTQICASLKVSQAERKRDIAAIALMHNANYVLRSSIQREGEVIRVRVQLVRSDNSNVWSENPLTIDLDTDVFAQQSSVAINIAQHAALQLGFDLLKLHPSATPELKSVKPAAREEYFKAHEQWVLWRNGEGGARILAQNYLKKAIEADSEFAFAYILLANTYANRVGGMSLEEATPLALDSIEKAISLNPTSPDFLLQAGLVHLALTLNYREAAKLYQQGLKQQPDWVWFYVALADIALREGRVDDALPWLQQAKSIPGNVQRAGVQQSLIWFFYFSGHPEESLEISSRGLALVSGGQIRLQLLLLKIAMLIELGNLDEAELLMDEAWRLGGKYRPLSMLSFYARTGQDVRVKEILADLQPARADPFELAVGYLALGEHARALESIEAAIVIHHPLILSSLRVSNFWDPLRCEDKFEEILKRVEQMETLTDAGERAKAARKREGSDCELKVGESAS